MKETSHRLKLTFELVLLIVHVLAGGFTGLVMSIGEIQEERIASIGAYALACLLGWVVARLYGKYFFFDIETISQGLIVGAIFGVSQAVIIAISGRVFLNIFITSIVAISIGMLIGGIYGKVGQVLAEKKVAG